MGLALIVLVFCSPPHPSHLSEPVMWSAAKAQMWELVNDELGLIAALVRTVFAGAGYPRPIRWQQA